jgi:hypothetical protein
MSNDTKLLSVTSSDGHETVTPFESQMELDVLLEGVQPNEQWTIETVQTKHFDSYMHIVEWCNDIQKESNVSVEDREYYQAIECHLIGDSYKWLRGTCGISDNFRRELIEKASN